MCACKYFLRQNYLWEDEWDKDLSLGLHFLIFKSMNVFTNFSCTFFKEKHVQVTCLQKYGDTLQKGLQIVTAETKRVQDSGVG